jgi:DHA1 family multidrug resistance protein-like MFS transporter
LLGLLGGFIPNANALIATQIPAIRAAGRWDAVYRRRQRRAAWPAGGRLSGRPLGTAHRLLYDRQRAVYLFYLTCFSSAKISSRSPKRDAQCQRCLFVAENPKLVLSLFVTSMIIQVATGSIAPILTLYVRDLAGNVSNIAFISG